MNGRMDFNAGRGMPNQAPPYRGRPPQQPGPRGGLPSFPQQTRQMFPSRQQQPQGQPKKSFMSRRQSQRPMQHPPNGYMQRQGNPQPEKKGLLSKILKKPNKQQAPAPSMFSLPSNSSRGAGAAAAAQGTAAASSGGFLQSIMDPGNLTNMLNNTQRVLQAADSFAPLVQQYGPLVKNIPSMWKLFRGLKNTDPEETTQDTEKEATTTPPAEKVKQESQAAPAEAHPKAAKPPKAVHIQPNIQKKKEAANHFKGQIPGESRPKLFYPQQ
ncbi:VrrA/YqfQ family protein [Bacillus testis]|uniref:VrrA/YqfQ family protein n=1 Tax=Bacillus testis TaxID=1622072 RepID=UPI00164D636E|nr:VrrA/YqfQ family protein [Bacillus testis]